MSWPGGRIVIKVLPPVPTAGLTLEDIDSLNKRVRDDMVKTFDELNEETLGKKVN
jgi:hypothetical protein